MKEQTIEIAYQNKDITSKIFAEKFAGKSFQVYGVDLPKIKQVLPTNLPAIQANELRMDHFFLLEDGSFLLVDYESIYKPENKLKYLGYILRVLERYYKTYGMNMSIAIVILYTADVQENQTENTLNVGSVQMNLRQAFLSKLDSEQIRASLTAKIQQGKKLSEEELMQAIILPLTYQGKEQKKQSIKQLFELVKEIPDEETQLFLLAGILVFTDKVIDKKTAQQIKEWIRMTKVARLFEEEKMEAVNEAVKKEKAETIKQIRQIVKKLLESHVDRLDIMKATGLTKKELEEIEKELKEK